MALVRTAIAVSVVGVLAACSSPRTPAATTAPVEFSTVSMGVSSTGSLSAVKEQNLGFAKGGQLTSVLVKVGDHVKAGQKLATVDPVPARQALAAQQAQLRAAEAALDKATDSPAVHDAKNSLDQANDVLDAVRQQAAAQDDADRVAVYNAQQQLIADEAAANSAQSNQASACAGSSSSAACMSAQSSYSAARQRVVSSQSALRAANQKREVDHAASQVSIETAQQAVVTARNSVDLSRSDRPHTIDQQEALVAAARAAVTQAQHDVANTTLRAPVAGTVTALNGAVGEYLSPSSGTSALAPGTDAAIPGASGSTSGGSSANSGPQSAAGASPARPGGNQFVVLSDIDQLEVVALFNESDAADLTSDERVRLTFDAVPDLTVDGSVASVAPSGTAVAGVISYYVTVTLDDRDSRLKAGQTANVGIVTSEKSDVLTVPTSAVRRVHGRSAVTVVEDGKPRTVTFEPGVVGIDRTEVVSGLREGQQVVLPVRRPGGDQG